MDKNFYEFVDKINTAEARRRKLKLLRDKSNLSLGSDGIYNYGTKIGHLDLHSRIIKSMGYLSPTNSRHYKYACRMLENCYDFQKPE